MTYHLESAGNILEDLGHIPAVDERRTILHQLSIPRASDETWAMAVEIYMERHP